MRIHRLNATMLVGLIAIIFNLCACGSARTTTKTSDPLTVFAAASLTEPFNNLQAELKNTNSSLNVTYNFAGSGTIVYQVKQGAPADVIATADESSMQQLTEANLVEPSTIFAGNKLAILVAPNNPKNIHSLADLADDSLKVVLCDSSVPAGRYSTQILQTASITIKPISKEVDVKSAVTKVTSGEADATIVYQTDVIAAGSRGEGITIPDSQNVIAKYPIAIVKTTTHREEAETFVKTIVSGSGQNNLKRGGFLDAN